MSPVGISIFGEASGHCASQDDVSYKLHVVMPRLIYRIIVLLVATYIFLVIA
jgi:hypothetical protein